MFLHGRPPICKSNRWINDEQRVEDCSHPDVSEFDSYRLETDRKSFRITPRIRGLWIVKRAITFAYGWHLISLRFAQRLVDLSKCWEA